MKKFTRPDNQQKVILPTNTITDKIWYTSDDNENMRIIVSILSEKPITWKVTKVENVQPFGLITLALYQDRFDSNTDYVNMETGEMYADYYEYKAEPSDQNNNITTENITAKISASTTNIKVGGSYKNLTVNIYNTDGDDITKDYSSATFTWTCSINDTDWTDKVTWRSGSFYNQYKIKFPDDMSQLGNTLEIKCSIVNNEENIESETSQFELLG